MLEIRNLTKRFGALDVLRGRRGLARSDAV